MSRGKINLQANDGSVVGLVVPDGLGSGERQIALGANLSGIPAYHLLQGNLLATINANYIEASATTTRNYTTTDYIFDSLNNKLYDCILASTSGALLTNTTYFTVITAGTLQLNTALVPFANGIDSNGAKNTIVYKNETITGLTYTSGKNYVYAKNDGTYGVSKFKEKYNSYNGFGDYFNTNKNKWFSNISTFSDDCSTIANFIADEVTGGTASVISSVNGELKVLNSGATYGGARFQFSTINGKKYRVKFKLASNSTTCTFGIGTSARSLNLGYVSLSGAGDYYLDIVASGTQLYGIAYNNNVSGAISTWDDIAIYPINYDGSVDISNAIEITESRNYLDAIVHADANGQVVYVEELPKIEYKANLKVDGFDLGQTWKNVTASRLNNTNYQNTTGKPIFISCECAVTGTLLQATLIIDGLEAQAYVISGFTSNTVRQSVCGVVPNGSIYKVVTSGGILVWNELR